MDVKTLLDVLEEEMRRLDDRYFELDREYQKARKERDDNSAAVLWRKANYAYNRSNEIERTIMIIKEFSKREGT